MQEEFGMSAGGETGAQPEQPQQQVFTVVRSQISLESFRANCLKSNMLVKGPGVTAYQVTPPPTFEEVLTLMGQASVIHFPCNVTFPSNAFDLLRQHAVKFWNLELQNVPTRVNSEELLRCLQDIAMPANNNSFAMFRVVFVGDIEEAVPTINHFYKRSLLHDLSNSCYIHAGEKYYGFNGFDAYLVM